MIIMAGRYCSSCFINEVNDSSFAYYLLNRHLIIAGGDYYVIPSQCILCSVLS